MVRILRHDWSIRLGENGPDRSFQPIKHLADMHTGALTTRELARKYRTTINKKQYSLTWGINLNTNVPFCVSFPSS